MKTLIILTAGFLFGMLAHAEEKTAQVTGNNNNVNICQPKIEVKSCGGSCCNAKTVTKTKVVEKRVEVPVPVEVEVEKIVEKKVIKKHIVSLFAHRAVVGGSEQVQNNKSAHADVRTDIVPGLMYQYQFDGGLVPMVGLDVTGQFIGGLGIEF